MTAPSNANTSGLEVVAWRIREQPGTAWAVVYDHEDHRLAIADGFESEPFAFTAASAQARIAELEAETEALTKALTSLTCGGSEFFTRKGDRYVADIKTCVDWVRRAKNDAHRRFVEAIKRATAAKARADRLAKGIVQAEILIDDAIKGIQTAPLSVVTDTIWTADPCPMTVVEALQLARAALQQETQP